MIGSLRGTVVDRPTAGEVVVEVGGVGYRVSVPTRVASVLGDGEVFLYVATHVRDDAIVLYGFTTAEERRTFEALVAAHGVGPSLALAVLSALTPAALAEAVAGDDVDLLCTVPGVGKKTAARMVLELQSTLGASVVAGPVGERSSGDGAARRDARAALAELGYGADEVRGALATVPGDDAPEDQVRAALRNLAGAR
ncbi:MAG: Holliday junction branch migration protein RuvA [Actinomycetota bacterium]|nr:Holliday junction branch migration protein RuvA [Actinomycetota bacterium]